MAAVFDREHFDLMTGADAALQAEVIGIFREQAPGWRAQLSPEAPQETWRDTAHALKGSALGLGLWVLAEACAGAETLGKSEAPDAQAAAAALAAARAALAEALAALELASP